VSRPSTVDQLPEEIRSEIGRLRMQGVTIDGILAHLRALHGETQVSRSALGRHLKGVEKLGERVRRSRQVAEVLVRELGDAPESQAARMNIELMHGAVLDLFMKSADGEDVAEGGKEALAGDPEGVMMLAKALDHLTRASRSNVEFIAAAEKRAIERAKRDAVKVVDAVAREKGITTETLDAIKAGIFGVKAA
jgi:hypothetical protein